MFNVLDMLEFLINHEILNCLPAAKIRLRDRLVAQWVEHQLDSYEIVSRETFTAFLDNELDTFYHCDLKSQLLNALSRNPTFQLVAVQPVPVPHRRRSPEPWP